jgi:multidrug resistance efflux pump
MAEESEAKKFFDRLKGATANVAQMTKEGVETIQVKRELSQAYGDLGRTTADLVESGALSHPELTEPVTRIGELKAQLAAASESDEETPAEPESAPAEPGTPPAEPEG